jgi:hypothetical protein
MRLYEEEIDDDDDNDDDALMLILVLMLGPGGYTHNAHAHGNDQLDEQKKLLIEKETHAETQLKLAGQVCGLLLWSCRTPFV